MVWWVPLAVAGAQMATSLISKGMEDKQGDPKPEVAGIDPVSSKAPENPQTPQPMQVPMTPRKQKGAFDLNSQAKDQAFGMAMQKIMNQQRPGG